MTFKPSQRNDVYGITAHIDWQTPIGTFSVVPAWRHARKANLNTESAQQVANTQEANQYSVEARLVSNPGRFIDYILGAYYFSEQIDDDVHNSAGSIANFNYGRFTTHSPSAYVSRERFNNLCDWAADRSHAHRHFSPSTVQFEAELGAGEQK